MTAADDETTKWLARLEDGDEAALEWFFSAMRDKLRRMVHYRLDARLTGRVDEDDVLQEAWLDAVQRIESFRANDATEVFVWLRRIVGQTLVDLHRQHLGAKMRSANQEVRLSHLAPRANSATMSAMLVASLTSPSGAAMRAEANASLIDAIEGMDPVDREILVLRHFEELGNDEVAAVLELTRSTASYRYIKALAKLKAILDSDS